MDRYGGISIFDLAARPRNRDPKPIPYRLTPRYMAPLGKP
jgi:hypothetical protein